jgi:3'(2'), 5'-bisphosphate nucleotidase
MTSMRDDDLAHELATQAGQLLLSIRRELADAMDAVRREEGDRRSQAFLARRLREVRPEDAVLSEESLDDGRRLHAPRVWIIDPLDGTREFGELGRHDWAVHVALWAGGLVAGAVALPAQGVTLSTANAIAAPSHLGAPRILVSRTRPPTFATLVAKELGGDAISMGSAGAKVAAIVRGAADVYIHSGGQYEWDSAAPVAVALAAGLHASRIDGSALAYNQPDPFLPDLLVCRHHLARPALNAIQRWFAG